jgi:hypothetical protein
MKPRFTARASSATIFGADPDISAHLSDAELDAAVRPRSRTCATWTPSSTARSTRDGPSGMTVSAEIACARQLDRTLDRTDFWTPRRQVRGQGPRQLHHGRTASASSWSPIASAPSTGSSAPSRSRARCSTSSPPGGSRRRETWRPTTCSTCPTPTSPSARVRAAPGGVRRARLRDRRHLHQRSGRLRARRARLLRPPSARRAEARTSGCPSRSSPRAPRASGATTT